MRVEKIFKKGDVSYQISISLMTEVLTDKVYWSIGYSQRTCGKRKWLPASKENIPREWILETKAALLAKLDSTFNL